MWVTLAIFSLYVLKLYFVICKTWKLHIPMQSDYRKTKTTLFRNIFLENRIQMYPQFSFITCSSLIILENLGCPSKTQIVPRKPRLSPENPDCPLKTQKSVNKWNTKTVQQKIKLIYLILDCIQKCWMDSRGYHGEQKVF